MFFSSYPGRTHIDTEMGEGQAQLTHRSLVLADVQLFIKNVSEILYFLIEILKVYFHGFCQHSPNFSGDIIWGYPYLPF